MKNRADNKDENGKVVSPNYTAYYYEPVYQNTSSQYNSYPIESFGSLDSSSDEELRQLYGHPHHTTQ